jgi:hypothetical protein
MKDDNPCGVEAPRHRGSEQNPCMLRSIVQNLDLAQSLRLSRHTAPQGSIQEARQGKSQTDCL